jgi:PAS domain S-box-containing protein
MKPDIRLLIVDDNIVTRYALRRRLECHGYRIDEAGTGGEGLELIASQTYDALILDVHLPDMSGFDIVRILRATPATALLPVIHVSAAAIGTGDIITGLDAGADAYLIHPVDPEVLLATLRTLLRVRDTEQALRESEARFREIFVSTAAPIALLGTGLKVHECNQAFAQLIQDNLSPDTLVECFADDQQPVIDELLRRLGTRDRWKGLLHMRVNGQLRETQWQVSPYRSGESSLIFVEDVTEQRHRERTQRAELDSATTLLAQEVAERARTEAQLLQVQKMDALGKLTGGIAHDFNNMLTGIITSLELIKKRIEQGRVDKVQSYADAALGAAMGAATLTHRLLAFARQQPLDPRPADINQHIRSLEELLRRTIGEHISLHLNLSEHLSVALVDPIQLENAVLNLVINARDALPQGGNIWISTYAAHTQDDLKLADGAYVALSVRDDGSCIAPEVIGKVFDQAHRPGHRAGAVDHLRLRPPVGRRRADPQHRRARYRSDAAAAGQPEPAVEHHRTHTRHRDQYRRRACAGGGGHVGGAQFRLRGADRCRVPLHPGAGRRKRPAETACRPEHRPAAQRRGPAAHERARAGQCRAHAAPEPAGAVHDRLRRERHRPAAFSR